MSSPTDEEREREPFRWCVYCDADCDLDEMQHADDCPSVTGIWPVRIEQHCRTCACTEPSPFKCIDCGAEFKEGDFYMLRLLDPGDELLPGVQGAPVYESICIGCKAHDEIEAALCGLNRRPMTTTNPCGPRAHGYRR